MWRLLTVARKDNPGCQSVMVDQRSTSLECLRESYFDFQISENIKYQNPNFYSVFAKKIMKSQHQYLAITVKKCLNLNFGISMKFPNFDFHILVIMKKTLGQNEIPKFESQNMILANTLLGVIFYKAIPIKITGKSDKKCRPHMKTHHTGL